MISLNTIRVVTEAEEKPSKTYKLDLVSGKITSLIDEKEAIEQYIRKAILTPRFKCLLYGSNYGSEIEAMVVANHWNRDIEKSIIPGLVKSALNDSRVLDVYNFSFEDGENCLYVSFSADTIFGTVEIKEEMSFV